MYDVIDGKHPQYDGLPDLHLETENGHVFQSFYHKGDYKIYCLPGIVDSIEVFCPLNHWFQASMIADIADKGKLTVN